MYLIGHYYFCIKRIPHPSYKIVVPTAPEEQKPTLSLWIWRQKALLPEFSYFFLCEQMVFLFISCQIFPITMTVVYWETTMCWVLHRALKPQTSPPPFSFCLNLDRKMRKNLDRKMLWKSQTLNYAYTLLFTVSTFETAVDVQMKVAMWSGKCRGIHLWRLCISPALEPTEKEIVVHSIKYCQYD